MRIYFVGSHATGKTTMTRYVSRRFGLPMITEIARAVLAELEISFDTLRTDMDLVGRNGQMIPVNMQVDANNVVTQATFANAQYFLEQRPYDQHTKFYNINPGSATVVIPVGPDNAFNPPARRPRPARPVPTRRHTRRRPGRRPPRPPRPAGRRGAGG